MKKIFLICTMCILLVLPVSTSYASIFDNQIKIEELGVSFSIPQEYYYITRDSDANNPAFEYLNTDKDTMVQYFIDNYLYFDAFDRNIDYELVLISSDNIVTDMNQLTDLELSTTIAAIKTEYAKEGLEVTKTEIETINQAKYIKMDMRVDLGDGSYCYLKQYYTINNKKAFIFRLSSYTDSINDKQKSALENLVGTVKFDTAPVYDRDELEDITVNEEDVKRIVDDIAGDGTYSSIEKILNVVLIGTITTVGIGIIVIIIIIVIKAKKKKENSIKDQTIKESDDTNLNKID